MSIILTTNVELHTTTTTTYTTTTTNNNNNGNINEPLFNYRYLHTSIKNGLSGFSLTKIEKGTIIKVISNSNLLSVDKLPEEPCVSSLPSQLRSCYETTD